MRTLTAMGLVLSLTILVTPDTFAQGRGGQRGMRGRSANGFQGQMAQQWQMQNRYGRMGQGNKAVPVEAEEATTTPVRATLPPDS